MPAVHLTLVASDDLGLLASLAPIPATPTRNLPPDDCLTIIKPLHRHRQERTELDELLRKSGEFTHRFLSARSMGKILAYGTLVSEGVLVDIAVLHDDDEVVRIGDEVDVFKRIAVDKQ